MESICNFRRVSDRLASSGQPQETQFRIIRDAGFEVVINLAMPNSDHVIPDEGNLVTAYGMSYANIPVPWEKPETKHLQQFFGLMQTFENNKVWVHCVKNFRVSAFLYCYYRSNGMSEAASKAVMLPQWEPIQVWRDFMNTHS